MTSVSFLWRKQGPFRDFVMNSPAGEVVGRVIEADTIQIFHDHLFHKPAGSPSVMQWHADHLWPFTGTMVPNIWVALSPVNQENGRIEFVAGYHTILHGDRFAVRPGGRWHFPLSRFPGRARRSGLPVQIRHLGS